jgi:DNA-binding PadR family transcriptional regulator
MKEIEMKPLNYAILKYYTTGIEASADDVIEALKGEYGNFKTLRYAPVLEALMTAEANGLLEESRFDLDDKGEIRVYYRANEEGIKTINSYIKD